MKIAIIGAGYTGLTAAYELAKAGHKVTVFEKNSYAGGLSAGIKKGEVEGWNLECFQHHFFANDTEVFSLIKELGLGDKLLKLSPKTSILYQDKLYRFDTPLSLLSFPCLSIFEKAKLGSAIAYLKLTNNWKKMEGESADSWWKRKIGEKPYQMLWEPLLKGKFGNYYKEINMAWFWARIKKRTQKLYYLKGSLQVLVDRLVKEIESKEGKVRLSQKVDSVVARPESASGGWRAFDKIIITTPPQTLLKLLPDLPADYKEKIKKLRGIGAQALILFLDKPFLTDGTYWLNVNNAGFPFISVVEHTNFIDSRYYGGNHIIYIGNYLPAEHPYMQMSKEKLLKEFTPYLKKINSSFGNLEICHSFLARERFAQPIVGINHSKNIPSLQTPIPDIYFASMSQVYPWDRGVNYAIQMGRKVTSEILNSNV